MGAWVLVSLVAVSLAVGTTGAAAAIKDDLKAQTLLCDSGSQIKFDAAGTEALMVTSGGSSKVSTDWSADAVVLRAPGAKDGLFVKKSDDGYAIDKVKCHRQ